MAKPKSEKIGAERPHSSIRRTKAEQSRVEKKTPKPAVASAKVASNPELEAAIEKDPDAVDPYLVYADWLQTQGDPRGELIALAHANSQFDKSTPKGVRQERQRAYDVLRAERTPELLGLLAVHAKHASLEWHLGFLKSARVENRDVKKADLLPALMKELLRLPVSRFLRSLAIGQDSGAFGTGGRKQFGPMVRVLADSSIPATLERLTLVDLGEKAPTRTPIADLGDLSPLYPRLSALKSLHLRCAGVELGTVDLPSLTDFELQIGEPEEDLFRSLSGARWPNLTRFVIGFGTPGDRLPDGRRRIAEEGMGLLLSRTNVEHAFERLEEFGVRNLAWDFDRMRDEGKVFSRVRSLDLSGGSMSDAEAETMVQHQASYPNVERLNVSANYLTRAGVAVLKDAFEQVEAAGQRNAAEEAEYFDEIEE